MGTCPLFKVPEDRGVEFYEKIEPKLREAQEIVRKWAKKASESYHVELEVVIGDWGDPFINYKFKPEDFNPEEIRRAFKALKYAYDGASKELEKKRIKKEIEGE